MLRKRKLPERNKIEILIKNRDKYEFKPESGSDLVR